MLPRISTVQIQPTKNVPADAGHTVPIRQYELDSAHQDTITSCPERIRIDDLRELRNLSAYYPLACRAAAHEDICRKVTKPVVLMRCPKVRYSTPRATRLVVWNAVVPTKVIEDSAS